MKKDEKKQLVIITSILLVIVIVIAIYSFSYWAEEEHKACRELGFEEFTYKMGFRYCKDNLGNFHYIGLVCNSFGSDCKAKEISVGNVRVISERGN